MKIGEQIRSRRQAIKMSVQELADASSVSPQSVRYWESNRSNPNKETAKLVEAALGISLDWTEGASSGMPSAAQLLNELDVQLMLRMSKLPVKIKLMIGDLADLISDHHHGAAVAQPASQSVDAFNERKKRVPGNEQSTTAASLRRRTG